MKTLLRTLTLTIFAPLLLHSQEQALFEISEDTVLMYNMQHDSCFTYREYNIEDTDKINAVFLPYIEGNFYEQSVLNWIDMNYEFKSIILTDNSSDHNATFSLPHKVVMSRNKLQWSAAEGEEFVELPLSGDFIELYNGATQMLIANSNLDDELLFEVRKVYIDSMAAIGFSYEFRDGIHTFSSEDMQIRIDQNNRSHHIIYYTDQSEIDLETLEFYGEDADGVLYPVYSESIKHDIDPTGLPYRDYRVTLSNRHKSYSNPSLTDEVAYGNDNDIVVLPVPARDYFRIEFLNGDSMITEVKLFSSLNGETVKTWEGEYDSNHSFEISEIPEGNYVLMCHQQIDGSTLIYNVLIQIL